MSKILMTSQIVGDAPILTRDSWNESDHPRAENGQFGSGGGGAKASPKGGAKASSGSKARAKLIAAHAKFGSGGEAKANAKLDSLLQKFSSRKDYTISDLAYDLVHENFSKMKNSEALAEALVKESKLTESTADPHRQTLIKKKGG